MMGSLGGHDSMLLLSLCHHYGIADSARWQLWLLHGTAAEGMTEVAD